MTELWEWLRWLTKLACLVPMALLVVFYVTFTSDWREEVARVVLIAAVVGCAMLAVWL